MLVRRNSDARRRQLERQLAEGDVEAAEQLLFQVARQGAWFLPEDWVAPGGHGPPYVDRVNDQRARWVRLLGYLKWPHAPQFQKTVAGQAPQRGPIHEHGWSPDGLEYAHARHLLGQIRPFTRIGPEVAQDIGPEVMAAVAEAAAWEAFQVSALGPDGILRPLDKNTFWNAPMELVRQIRRQELAQRLAWDSRDREEADRIRAQIRQLESGLGRYGSSIRINWRDMAGHAASDAACFHARESLDDFFGAVVGHPSNARYDQAIFHAIMALGFACDARKGRHEVTYQRDPWFIGRTKGDWGDRAGAAPSRGCMAVANRKVKQAMLPAAILAIASEMVRYS